MGTAIRLAGALLLTGACSAEAADLGPIDAPMPAAERTATAFRLFDEIRASVLAHDFVGGEDGVALGGEILTSEIPIATGNRLLDAVFGPRVHLGGVAAIDSDPNYVYAGFTWTVPVTEVFFLEGALSMSLNDGGDDGALRCDWSFREKAAVGMKLDANWRILAGVEHLSHAGLCGDANPGITSLSATVGYRF